MAEYRDVPNSIAYMLDAVGSPLRKVKRWTKAPVKKPVINIASD